MVAAGNWDKTGPPGRERKTTQAYGFLLSTLSCSIYISEPCRIKSRICRGESGNIFPHCSRWGPVQHKKGAEEARNTAVHAMPNSNVAPRDTWAWIPAGPSQSRISGLTEKMGSLQKTRVKCSFPQNYLKNNWKLKRDFVWTTTPVQSLQVCSFYRGKQIEVLKRSEITDPGRSRGKT